MKGDIIMEFKGRWFLIILQQLENPEETDNF